MNRRDLVMVLATAVPLEKDQRAAFGRLQLATQYEPFLVRKTIARYHTRTALDERDARIARLSSERLTDTEIALMEGVHPNTVTNARKRVMSQRNMEGIKESFFGDLEAIIHNAWSIVHNPPPKVSQQGRPVTMRVIDPLSGEVREEVVPDMERVLSALDLARKSVADMRTLTGADAPKRTISAKVDLRQQAEQMWHEMLGQEPPPITAEVISSE